MSLGTKQIQLAVLARPSVLVMIPFVAKFVIRTENLTSDTGLSLKLRPDLRRREVGKMYLKLRSAQQLNAQHHADAIFI